MKAALHFPYHQRQQSPRGEKAAGTGRVEATPITVEENVLGRILGPFPEDTGIGRHWINLAQR